MYHKIHYERMHDPLVAMLQDIDERIDVQWPEGAYPVYNVEPLIDADQINTRIMRDIIIKHVPIYDFDRRNVSLLNDTGRCVAHWRPVIWTKTLQAFVDKAKDAERDIDVLFIGNETGRRKDCIDAIRAHGINVQSVVGIYGTEASSLLKRSKICLNIHRTGAFQAQEQLRIAWALCAGCVVISETSIEPSIPEPIIIESCIDAIPSTIAGALISGAKTKLEEWKRFSAVIRAKTWGR
jgi:hypothetical protein